MLDDKESAPQGEHSLDLRITSRYIRKATQSSELHTQIQYHPQNYSPMIPKHQHVFLKKNKEYPGEGLFTLVYSQYPYSISTTYKRSKTAKPSGLLHNRIKPLQFNMLQQHVRIITTSTGKSCKELQSNMALHV